MILKNVKFKTLKLDTLFEFNSKFYVKTSTRVAKALGNTEPKTDYMFSGSELVECDSSRIKKWYNFKA